MKSKKLIRAIILFDLGVLVLLLPFLLLNKEKVELNDNLRSMSNTNFTECSEGFVHYELSGPADG